MGHRARSECTQQKTNEKEKPKERFVQFPHKSKKSQEEISNEKKNEEKKTTTIKSNDITPPSPP